jgi:general secretion pathway protein D
LHKEELLPTLEMLLRINGAVLIKRDGLYRIEPEAVGAQMAGTSGMKSKKLKPGYQIKVVPLKYVGAIDMSEILAPILPPKAVIKVDPARNILMLAGTRDELTKAMDLVDTFDVNFIAGMSFGLFSLENTDAASTVAEIKEIFNGGEKSPLTGMLRFISIKNLNAILVVTQQKEYLKEAEKWITRLDEESGAAAGEGGLIVYRVQHVDAVELAGTLNDIISGSSSSSSKRPPSLAPGENLASLSNKKRDPKKRKTKTRSKSSNNGAGAFEGVNVIADEPNNALVIMAQSQQYRMLKKVIKQLDVMPLQVLLEAKIISVDLRDELKYGMQWTFENNMDLGGSRGVHTGVGGLNVGGQSNILDIGLNSALSAVAQGFTYGLVDNGGNLKVALNLLADNNKIDIISTPSLMVLNNQEGSIKVGDSIPIRTSESTNTSGGVGANGNINNLIQTSPIQNEDTGVDLTVTPRVNANGTVILEIEQKVNELSPNQSTVISSPTILKREIKSSVAVVDGESVVLGGLMTETHTDGNVGIPILKDIPYLGWLFGSQIKNVRKNELIVIITPRVIEDKYDARKVTDEYKRKLTGIFYNRDEYKPGWGKNKRDTSGRVISNEEYEREVEHIDRVLENNYNSGRSRGNSSQTDIEHERMIKDNYYRGGKREKNRILAD